MFFKYDKICVTPERQVMISIIDRIIFLDEKIRKGESLTRKEEKEKWHLNKLARTMKNVQNYYALGVNPLHTPDPNILPDPPERWTATGPPVPPTTPQLYTKPIN